MQLKLNDGTTLEVLTVNGTSTYYSNANRDSLEIQLEKGTYSFNELDALTANPFNTDKLLLIDGESQFLHEHYTLRTELSVKPISLPSEEPGAPATTKERICVVLAQRTYGELMMDGLRDTVDALVLATL